MRDRVDPGAPGSQRRRALRVLGRSLFGLFGGLLVGALAARFLDVQAGQVWEDVKRVPLWATVFCVASSFVMMALQSFRWHRVMGPLLGLRYPDALRAQAVGFLFNALLPARGGDLLRVQYLGRRTGKNRATILGTELVDRCLDWWGWIPTFLVLLVVSAPPVWLYKAMAIFAGLLGALAFGVFLVTRAGRAPREGSALGKLFGAVRVGVLAVRDRRIWVTAFLVAPLPWLWEACALAIAGRGFGCPVSVVQGFSMLIAFNLAMAIPSPGGVGMVESGGMLALDLFGFDHSRSLVFITVYHFSQLIPGIMSGAAVLFFQGERLFGALATADDSIEATLAAPEGDVREAPAS